MCNCRKRALPTQNIQPKKIASLAELRDKIVNSKQATIISNVKPASNTLSPNYTSIFTNIKESTNINNIQENKMILLISKQGNAESKYLKNLVSKIYTIEKYSFKLKELDYSYLVNTKEVTEFPTTILYYKNKIYKTFSHLFDVKAVLSDFNKLT